MPETSLLRDIQVALSRAGARVFRNNVGLFTTDSGAKVRTGLCVGSSDLIGWTANGRFLAVEVKTPKGRLTQEQIHFIDAVRAHGGVAFCARSVEEAITKLNEGQTI